MYPAETLLKVPFNKTRKGKTRHSDRPEADYEPGCHPPSYIDSTDKLTIVPKRLLIVQRVGALRDEDAIPRRSSGTYDENPRFMAGSLASSPRPSPSPGTSRRTESVLTRYGGGAASSKRTSLNALSQRQLRTPFTSMMKSRQIDQSAFAAISRNTGPCIIPRLT